MSERENSRREDQPPIEEKTEKIPSFGDLLHTIRKREGLTRRAMAEATGVHESLIGKIEDGERKSIRLALNAANIPGIKPIEAAVLIRTGLREAFGLSDENLDTLAASILNQKAREHDYGYKTETTPNGNLSVSYHLSSPVESVQKPELEIYEKMIGLELASALDTIDKLREQRGKRQRKLKIKDTIFVSKDHLA